MRVCMHMNALIIHQFNQASAKTARKFVFTIEEEYNLTSYQLYNVDQNKTMNEYG